MTWTVYVNHLLLGDLSPSCGFDKNVLRTDLCEILRSLSSATQTFWRSFLSDTDILFATHPSVHKIARFSTLMLREG